MEIEAFVGLYRCCWKICWKFDVTPSYSYPLWVSESYRSRNTCCHRVVCVFKPYRVRKLLNVYILQVVYFVYLFPYSMANIKRLMYCTPKMSDNACPLHCYDTADNNVRVHWHYRSPECDRPGRISGTLCLNAPFARVCENSYIYDMAHAIIKCRVTFGKNNVQWLY